MSLRLPPRCRGSTKVPSPVLVSNPEQLAQHAERKVVGLDLFVQDHLADDTTVAHVPADDLGDQARLGEASHAAKSFVTQAHAVDDGQITPDGPPP